MIRVYISSVIEAPADRSGSRCATSTACQRAPAVADSRIEGSCPSDRIGCIRNFHTKDGGLIREQLLSLSDYDYECTYSILDSPMGVSNYVATLKLTPMTDGHRTFAEWSAEFDCDEAREGELSQTRRQAACSSRVRHLKRRSAYKR